LPTRPALWAVALITTLTAGAMWLTLSWSDFLSPIVGLVVVGCSASAVRRLVTTTAELQAAHEELAQLAVAEERLRFARDLHDLLGHTLSLIVLKSELARELTVVAPGRVASEIGDVERAAREALREVRAVVAGYRQPTLAGELAGARQLLAAAGIEVRIEHASGELPLALDTTLAWAVREGITNVIHHSRARCCHIRTARLGDEALIEIIDDGSGMPGCSTMGGSGLAGLRERIGAHGGRIVTGSQQPSGYRLSVTLPIHSTIEGSSQ
jgi:two-component system sensor histidine kinase DesK